MCHVNGLANPITEMKSATTPIRVAVRAKFLNSQ